MVDAEKNTNFEIGVRNGIQGHPRSSIKQTSKLRIELQRLCANDSCNYFGTNSTHSPRNRKKAVSEAKNNKKPSSR